MIRAMPEDAIINTTCVTFTDEDGNQYSETSIIRTAVVADAVDRPGQADAIREPRSLSHE